MGVGRYLCVALPFILTVASIIAFLVAGLTGVASNDLYLFRVDVTNLTIDASDFQSFIDQAGDVFSGQTADDIQSNITQAADEVSDKIKDVISRSPVEWHDATLLAKAQTDDSSNITASDLGLANKYDFTLWGYCVTPQDGKRNCTTAQFDWASKELDLDWVANLTEQVGLNITVPKTVKAGLDAYANVTKWTQVVFIIAIIALALELVVGLFTACSRGVSCVTWIISGIATAAVIATAVLLTVTGATVIGVILGASSHFGVKASLNTSYLAVVWISVAFALGAGLFWLFSICCCKPESRSHARSSRHQDSEKLIPSGSYAPLGENRNSAHSGFNYNAPAFGAPQRGGARSDLAYEPYSHSRV